MAEDVSVSAAVSGFSANFVAWVCFGLGVALVAVGTVQGLRAKTAIQKDADRKKAEGIAAVTQLEVRAQDLIETEALADQAAGEAARDVQQTGSEAKSKFEDLASLVGSLPEHLRFPGLLIVVGAALIGVATVQFGGTSLF